MNKYILALVLLCSGCSLAGSVSDTPAVKLEPLPDSQIVEIQITRKKYLSALNDNPALNRVRVIRIFSRNEDVTGNSIPRYRLFDVQPGSVYTLLGLRVADVLYSASGYSISEPQKFPMYVRALAGEKKAHIQILRDDKPIIYKYQFVD